MYLYHFLRSEKGVANLQKPLYGEGVVGGHEGQDAGDPQGHALCPLQDRCEDCCK